MLQQIHTSVCDLLNLNLFLDGFYFICLWVVLEHCSSNSFLLCFQKYWSMRGLEIRKIYSFTSEHLGSTVLGM